MKALLFAAVVVLAGCQVQQPTAPGTVVGVREAPAEVPEDLLRFDEGNLRLPEVAWKVDVQLDNGDAVTVTHGGERRFEPGERVRLLVGEEGALLL